MVTTVEQAKTSIAHHVPDIARRFDDAQMDEALQRAHILCRPLGLRKIVEATPGAAEDEFVISDPISIPIERVRLVTTFRGVQVTEVVAVNALRTSQDAAGLTTLKFPRPLAAGTTVSVTATVLPALPGSGVLPYFWGDVLVSYAIAELYALITDHGGTLDITQFQELEAQWRMKGDDMKARHLIALGIQMGDEEENKKPKGKGRK